MEQLARGVPEEDLAGAKTTGKQFGAWQTLQLKRTVRTVFSCDPQGFHAQAC